MLGNYLSLATCPQLSSGVRVIPLDLHDLRELGYTATSFEIDTWFNGIVALGKPYPGELIVVGHENPTSASAVSRQELFDEYTFVIYNEGFTL